MEVKVEKQVVVTLKLTLEEADLLKSMIQNGSTHETNDIRTFREKLFNLLPWKHTHE